MKAFMKRAMRNAESPLCITILRWIIFEKDLASLCLQTAFKFTAIKDSFAIKGMKQLTNYILLKEHFPEKVIFTFVSNPANGVLRFVKQNEPL